MLQQKARPSALAIVRPCNKTPYPTEERAREVLYFMTLKGINTNRLRVVHCQTGRHFHIEYTNR